MNKVSSDIDLVELFLIYYCSNIVFQSQSHTAKHFILSTIIRTNDSFFDVILRKLLTTMDTVLISDFEIKEFKTYQETVIIGFLSLQVSRRTVRTYFDQLSFQTSPIVDSNVRVVGADGNLQTISTT